MGPDAEKIYLDHLYTDCYVHYYGRIKWRKPYGWAGWIGRGVSAIIGAGIGVFVFISATMF